MILSSLAALALVAEPRNAFSRDPDLRCFVAVLYAAGLMEEKADAAMQAGLASVTMYYLGKLDGRLPGIDLKREVTTLIQLPSFERELPGEMIRCGKEAEDRGAALQEFGQYLQGVAPFLDARPS
jgi:hypothetical protein